MTLKKNELKIDAQKAFKSISMPIVNMKGLCEKPKYRVALESFGIDLENFTPVIADEISVEQWIKVLQFYAKKGNYMPAQEILAGLKKIIKAKYN
jgi:hypothetical protein